MGIRYRGVILAAVFLPAVALAQSGFERVDLGGQARDAIVTEAEHAVYVALYDRNEVVKFDTNERRIVDRAAVGAGPAALALSSDGGVLACLNRLEDSVTLLRLNPLSVYATVECGVGARALAPLPEGGFAVANSYDDTLTLIDAARGEVSRVVDPVSSVPSDIAATEGYIGVVTRHPAAFLLFKKGEDQPGSTLDLGDTPSGIVALPGDRFAVATASLLRVIDATDGRVEVERIHETKALATLGPQVLALSGARVDVFDLGLAIVDSFDVPAGGWSVSGGETTVVVTAPTRNAIYVRGLRRVRSPVTPQPSAASVEGGESAARAGPPKRSRPRKLKAGRSVRRPPSTLIPEFETRAPTFRRDPGSPVSDQSFSEALASGTALGSGPGGFIAPEWQDQIENVEADRGERTTRGEGFLWLWEGNARLQLDNTLIKADRMTYDTTRNEARVEGNVRLEQETASLEAQSVYYRSVTEAVDEAAPTLVRPREAQPAAPRRRLVIGSFQAEAVHLTEPAREIWADSIAYDFVTETGEIINVRGRTGVLQFGADKLRIVGPNEYEGDDVWISTCDHDPPHYRLRLQEATFRNGQVILGRNARLQLGRFNTPLYLPRWKSRGYLEDRNVNYDVEMGHESDVGYFLNVAPWFRPKPNVDVGIRFFPTTARGIGLGLDSEYDFSTATESPMFRGKGSLRTLYTTQGSGYAQFYHRHEWREDILLLAQWEQWFKADFVKEFFHDVYRNRTGPRTFLNLTHTRQNQVLMATVSAAPNGFTQETEKLPEVAYHLLEREVAKNLYVSFDSVNGYYEYSPEGLGSARVVNVARLTYDGNVHAGFNAAPFVEAHASWYSNVLGEQTSEFRVTGTAGITLQSRLQRGYRGWRGFSGFKHIFMPSVTYTYSPNSTLDPDDTPQFDALDNVPGRSRIESKIENIFMGRSARTGEVWQVARVSFYQGYDIFNEFRRAGDYEVEFDIRPRPEWGFLATAEHHSISGDSPVRYFARLRRRLGSLGSDLFSLDEEDLPFGSRVGDFDRVLSYFYYDDQVRESQINGRLGFAYTERDDVIVNKEILYGIGARVNENWALAFEQRYDIERNTFTRQRYEVRRRLHRWELAIQIRDRASGLDFGFEMSLTDFPGARLRF